jgi:hypothetical protein
LLIFLCIEKQFSFDALATEAQKSFAENQLFIWKLILKKTFHKTQKAFKDNNLFDETKKRKNNKRCDGNVNKSSSILVTT